MGSHAHLFQSPQGRAYARERCSTFNKARPRLEAIALTTYSCHRKLCLAPGSENPPRSDWAGRASALNLAPEFRFARAYKIIEIELAQLFRLALVSLIEDGERIEFPHRGFGPIAIEGQMELAVLEPITHSPTI